MVDTKYLDEFDLFGDIGPREPGLSVPELKEKVSTLESQVSSLLEEKAEHAKLIEKLRRESALLKKQKEILERNISCIFRTAQSEIQRKDKEIESLRTSRQSRGRGSNG